MKKLLSVLLVAILTVSTFNVLALATKNNTALSYSLSYYKTTQKIKEYSPDTLTCTYRSVARKPKVTVRNSKGETIASNYYTVKYRNNKAVGTASVKITMKAPYTGSKTLNFQIVPATQKITLIKVTKKKSIDLIWTRNRAVSGYQVQYATNKKFTKNAVTKNVGKLNKDKVTRGRAFFDFQESLLRDEYFLKETKYNKNYMRIKKLDANTTYYVRVRSYKTVNGKKIYGAWSKTKSITTTSKTTDSGSSLYMHCNNKKHNLCTSLSYHAVVNTYRHDFNIIKKAKNLSVCKYCHKQYHPIIYISDYDLSDKIYCTGWCTVVVG